MKIAGVIGGIGPESTVEYYRFFVAAYRARNPDGSYPRVIINSIDLRRMLDLAGKDDPREFTAYLLAEVRRLEAAGADFCLLAANTPHLVFDALRRESAIPLISIVEAALKAATERGLKRVGLLGTRFTMGGRFYPDAFARAGVTIVVPTAAEQTYIHDKYMSELVKGIFVPETRNGLTAVVRRLKVEEGIDGLILGGTELPLILTEPEIEGIPLLDTTRLHVLEAVRQLLP